MSISVTNASVQRKTSVLAFAAYIVAMLMTLCAMFLDAVTIAGNDYLRVLLTAMLLAAGAVLLLVVSWKRIPAAVRVIAAGLILIGSFVLWNAGAERLMGW
jgi:hypothetical protein